jgi:hypothetical protein
MNYGKLLDLLLCSGWGLVYSVISGHGRNSYVTYYIAPRQDGGLSAVDTNAMIDALVDTFGSATTYIYKIEDVNNIWMIRGDILEITLPNK